MSNTPTAEEFLRALPPVLRNDRRMMALGQVVAEELSDRMSEIEKAAIYPRIDELDEALLDILAYDFKVDWYGYFTSTACPGPYLGGKFSWLAEEVNKRLAGGVTVVGDTLRVGMALHLERTNLYIASASLAIAGVRTGTYYLWSTEVVNGRVRITNSTSNVGKYGKVTGWINVDDAKAGAGLRDQTTDSRGLTKIVIDYASNVQAMAVYNLAQQLDLVAPGYYRSKYIDAAKTAQYIEIGQISAGDAEHVTTLCKKAAIEYKTAA